MLVVDGFATFFRVLVLGVGLLTLLSSGELPAAWRRRIRPNTSRWVLFSLVGQCLMAAANELIMVFIGIEISSISSYILAGYLRDDKRNNESALKYFLLGSFADGVPAVRCGLDLRCDGNHEPGGDPHANC